MKKLIFYFNKFFCSGHFFDQSNKEVSVWTFNLSSDTPLYEYYGLKNWHKETLGKLKVGETPTSWSLTRENLEEW